MSNKKIFIWHGKNQSNQTIVGELVARNKFAAKAHLRHAKIHVLKIRKKPEHLFRKFRSIKLKDIIAFSKQLATMLSSGIPIIQALKIFSEGHSNIKMIQIIEQLSIQIENGHSFSEALASYPKLFNSLYCNLIKTGEQIGALDIMLDRIATYKEKSERMKMKVKKALLYPITVLVLGFIITAIILIYVVPQFESLFEGFGGKLPFLTTLIIQISNFILSYGGELLFITSCTTVFIILLYRKKKAFRYFIERNLLSIPVFGLMIKKAAIAKFARTLATTFSAGIPILDGLKSVAYAASNIAFEEAALQTSIEVSQGKSLYQALQLTGRFPYLVIQMIKVGEETGQLDRMLNTIAEHYDEEVDYAAETINTLIEPLLMVFLGSIIGALIIAMYLPIFNLGTIL